MAANDDVDSTTVLNNSILLARSLKSYDTKDYNNNGVHHSDVNMVVGFNQVKFVDKCGCTSPNRDRTLCFDTIAAELFKGGEIWQSRSLLKDAMDTLASLHGWTVRLHRTDIQCNRYGTDVTSRNFASGPLHVGCTFRIQLTALVKDKYLKEAEGTNPAKWVYTDNWDRPVKVKKANCTHGEMCTPGTQNRIAASQRGGKYINDVPINTLYTLLNYWEHDGKLPTSTIKKAMARVWPKKKVVSKSDVFNIKVKVMRLFKVFKNTNGDYEAFKKMVNASDFLSGIDNETSIDDDEAYELAQSMWAEVNDAVENKDEALFSFIDFLKLIAARAKGFTYKLATEEIVTRRSGSGTGASVGGSGKKKLIGVLWQTATMRRNFELFGDVIGLDMMKRGLNKLLWPYAGVAMYDENKQLCLACEGVLCGERSDMYKFIADFLRTSTPKRTLEDIMIVAGDAFFTQALVRELGFTNARFVWDRWHLLDSGLEKIFGKSWYGKLKDFLVQMVQSDSEDEFNTYLHSAQQCLESAAGGRNGEIEGKLKKFAKDRDNYATYCIASIPGNRGLLGNANSEQNHSSALVFLNDGDKTKNGYCEHVVTLIRDLLHRERLKRDKTNQLLFGLNNKLRIERARLSQQNVQTDAVKSLIAAAEVLNFPTYERFKAQLLRAEKYLVKTSVTDPLTGEQIIHISSSQYPEAPPRKFHSETQRCVCRERLKEDDMCAHEIKLLGGFHPSCFKPCHMKRESVEGSLDGWEGPTTNIINELIGYDDSDHITSSPTHGDVHAIDAPISAGHMEPNGLTGTPDDVVGPIFDVHAEKSDRCQPLPAESIRTVLSAASDAYSRLDDDSKFEMSRLTLQLQELMAVNSNKSTKVASSVVDDDGQGFYVMNPSQSAIASQPKKRLIPIREKNAMAKSRKMDASLQKFGMKQVVTSSNNDQLAIEVNGKTGGRHCRFCRGNNHIYTNCQRRSSLTLHAAEYTLSTAQELSSHASTLRHRFMMLMPYAPYVPGRLKLGYFGSLEKAEIGRNVIIHEAHQFRENEVSYDQIVYRVSFLNNNAEIDVEKWISWEAMNTIITHTNKKIKFVYDETAVMKQGWKQRKIGHDMHHDGATTLGPSSDEDSFDDDMPLSALKLAPKSEEAALAPDNEDSSDDAIESDENEQLGRGRRRHIPYSRYASM